MVQFFTHLNELINKDETVEALSSQSHSITTEQALDWTKDVPQEFYDLTNEPIEHGKLSILDLPWSPIDVENTASTSTAALNSTDVLYNKLKFNPHTSSLIPNILSILSSNTKSDDEISTELVELLGFDLIELVMEIMSNRIPLSYKLAIVDDNVDSPWSKPTLTKRTGNQPQENGRTNQINFSVDRHETKRRMEENFRATAARPLFSGTATKAPEKLPHVYTSLSTTQGTVLSSLGSKFMLPIGTAREDKEDCEEVIIPPAKTVPPRKHERSIPITELDGLARGAFPGYKSLNRIQSIVYPTAYGTNENLLICAPTGAGKTDVAMLTVLRVIDQHLSSPNAKHTPSQLSTSIKKDDFKIIYVSSRAPMKALAAEIVRKLGKRLAWLSIRVRELTGEYSRVSILCWLFRLVQGDMQMSKQEIAETQIIVTTPEKWDVVTRKPTGEGELASKVKLLIIDEVHLLNEERGAVIETIVARTLRQVESTQSLIRIVGLSATLPNYLDVADFLRVSQHNGLFYFDSSFRPIPLEQHFLGIKGKPNSQQFRKNLDRVTFQKVLDLVQQGHQVMVFVHARKETVKSAQTLREMALIEGVLDDFSTQEHPNFYLFKRDIGMSRNREMKELFNDGFGIHHAGMLRSDRNMMERMFEARAIKVLFCTATLAWGVNLPAHAVIIKGTQVYDSSRGAFVNLSVLDVFQIFGRAGRPGMETSGEGYICTPEDQLDHYLEAVTAQHPIESKFIPGMVDSLNAEISLGTVSNIREAIQWIGYTYLFVRMKKNPIVYGMSHEEPVDDPSLSSKRNQLVKAAAQKLTTAGMINYNPQTESLQCTDLGRIAAKYYIRTASIEVFNQELRAKMSEADVLAVLSMSTEFEQVQLRENEIQELKHLMEEIIPCEVKGGTDTSQGKVNILLQGYISRAQLEDFALISDMEYVAQNGGRIIRSLVEIALSRRWANVCAALINMSKAVEKRMWPYDHPLLQFNLSKDVLHNLQRWADDFSISDLTSHSAVDLGKLIHMNEKHGAALLKAATEFPTVTLTHQLRPLASDLLQVSVRVTNNFNWNAQVHGSGEPFFLWIEDEDQSEIIQWRHITLRQDIPYIDTDFVIPIRGAKPPVSVTIRSTSDKWIGAEDDIIVPLDELIMPDEPNCHIPLLNLTFLQTSNKVIAGTLRNPGFRQLSGIQTQCFWSTMHTNQNILISSPSGSGKTLLAMIALCHKLMRSATKFGLVITPNRNVAKEVASLYKLSRIPVPVQLVTNHQALSMARGEGIRITTPQCLNRALQEVSSAGSKEWLENLGIVVCDNLELLDASYELAITTLLCRTQVLPVRFIGLSACLDDPRDLCRWLRVPSQGLFCFRPKDREQALITKSNTFNIPNSAALYKAMVRPGYILIRDMSPSANAVIFVPTLSLCYSMGANLITQCASDTNTKGFLGTNVTTEDLQHHVSQLRTSPLSDLLMHGIGIFHSSMSPSESTLCLQLYLEGVIRLIIVPHDTCWTLPIKGSVVLVMGTQYVKSSSGLGRQLENYDIHEIARMQNYAISPFHTGQFHLFCPVEHRDIYLRFLNEGLPLESELLSGDILKRWLQDMRKTGSIIQKQDAADALSFTFFFHRVNTNPTYYEAHSINRNDYLSRLIDNIWDME
ncbi:hypothetical protein Clacol_001469 [Clathrus columnatus]|uniref:Activating signal cointegrator 1 complex subunit 3 n=1 Tax=Clathrus columnatus TaxID=1419009 RepID=A0AAV5A3E4_9AGAM|nr:hypothetical protein Clacol_001469 [Clathrus columnatus]